MVNFRTSTRITAQLVGGTGVNVARQNGIYTVDIDFAELVDFPSINAEDYDATSFPLVQEIAGQTFYGKMTFSNLVGQVSGQFQPVDATLTALAGLDSSAGLLTQTTADTFTKRSLAAGTGISVSNADGSAGNPSVALDTASTRNTDHSGVTLTAGAGLTGGGDISASRSFAVGAGTGITVNADDVALDTASTRNTDHTAVALTAGAGLTGGGDISASRSFAVGAGTGIAVNADDVALAAIADDRIMANVSGGSAAPSANTLTTILDEIIGTTQGAIITRQGSAWVKLDPGASGTFLKSQGAGANIIYDTPAGAGDVVGPAGATDNAAARFDTATGKLLQNSVLIVADTTGALSRSGGGGIPVQGTNTNDSAAAGDIGEYASCSTGTTAAVTISNASPAVITETGHGMTAAANNYSVVNFTTTGGLPTGLSVGTNYYITVVDANTYKVSTSIANAVAGTFVNTSSAGSGTHTAVKNAVLSNGTVIDVGGLRLAAGDWDVRAVIIYAPAASTSVTKYISSVSATSATLDLTGGRFLQWSQAASVPGANSNIGLPSMRFSLSATTTLFFMARMDFSVSTAAASGIVSARRIR